jgi:hypothetical protein
MCKFENVQMALVVAANDMDLNHPAALNRSSYCYYFKNFLLPFSYPSFLTECECSDLFWNRKIVF